MQELYKTTTGRLNNGLPQVPPRHQSTDSTEKVLPIESLRREIVSTIAGHEVVMISGETGCGKTTQV